MMVTHPLRETPIRASAVVGLLEYLDLHDNIIMKKRDIGAFCCHPLETVASLVGGLPP